MKVVFSEEVFCSSEFKSFCDRFGIEVPDSTIAMSIYLERGKPVLVECDFYLDRGEQADGCT